VSKKLKRLQRLIQNPRDIPSDELIRILESFGFERKGGSGGHQCYKHSDLPEVKLTIPKQNPLFRNIVVQAINAIQKVIGLNDE
jgi:predicted RNA binding protein YcfA (HicA-like mRNA interferase family)